MFNVARRKSDIKKIKMEEMIIQIINNLFFHVANPFHVLEKLLGFSVNEFELQFNSLSE